MLRSCEHNENICLYNFHIFKLRLGWARAQSQKIQFCVEKSRYPWVNRSISHSLTHAWEIYDKNVFKTQPLNSRLSATWNVLMSSSILKDFSLLNRRRKDKLLWEADTFHFILRFLGYKMSEGNNFNIKYVASHSRRRDWFDLIYRQFGNFKRHFHISFTSLPLLFEALIWFVFSLSTSM